MPQILGDVQRAELGVLVWCLVMVGCETGSPIDFSPAKNGLRILPSLARLALDVLQGLFLQGWCQ